jgi:membrane fusion protein, multidrug efflux system
LIFILLVEFILPAQIDLLRHPGQGNWKAAMDGTSSATLAQNDLTVRAVDTERGSAVNKRRRRLLLASVVANSVATATFYGAHWYTRGRFLEFTNDAYLSADNVTVASEVTGYVTELLVADNQPVHRGDALVRIDPRDYQMAVDRAAADLESAQANAANIDAQLAEQQSVIAQSQAAVTADQAAVTFSEQELQRYADLARTGSGTAQRLQQAQADAGQKRSNLLRDLAALTAAKAHIGVLETQRRQVEGMIDHQRAVLAQGKVNLGRTVLLAPTDGIVGDRTGAPRPRPVRPGRYRTDDDRA